MTSGTGSHYEHLLEKLYDFQKEQYTLSAEALLVLIVPISVFLASAVLFCTYQCFADRWDRRELEYVSSPKKHRVQTLRAPLYLNIISKIIRTVLLLTPLFFIGNFVNYANGNIQKAAQPFADVSNRLNTLYKNYQDEAFVGVDNITAIFGVPLKTNYLLNESFIQKTNSIAGVGDLLDAFQKEMNGFAKTQCATFDNTCVNKVQIESLAKVLRVVYELAKLNTDGDAKRVLKSMGAEGLGASLLKMFTAAPTDEQVNNNLDIIFSEVVKIYAASPANKFFSEAFYSTNVNTRLEKALCETTNPSWQLAAKASPIMCSELHPAENSSYVYWRSPLQNYASDSGFELPRLEHHLIQQARDFYFTMSNIGNMANDISLSSTLDDYLTSNCQQSLARMLFQCNIGNDDVKELKQSVEEQVDIISAVFIAVATIFLVGYLILASFRLYWVSKGDHRGASREYCCDSSCNACACSALFLFGILFIVLHIATKMIQLAEQPNTLLKLLPSVGKFMQNYSLNGNYDEMTIYLKPQLTTYYGNSQIKNYKSYLELQAQPPYFALNLTKDTWAGIVNNSKYTIGLDFHLSKTDHPMNMGTYDVSQVDINKLYDKNDKTSFIRWLGAGDSFQSAFSRKHSSAAINGLVQQSLTDADFTTTYYNTITGNIALLITEAKKEVTTPTVDTGADTSLTARLTTLTGLQTAMAGIGTTGARFQEFSALMKSGFEGLFDTVSANQQVNLQAVKTGVAKLGKPTSQYAQLVKQALTANFDLVYNWLDGDDSVIKVGMVAQAIYTGVDTAVTTIDVLAFSWFVGIIMDMLVQMVLYHFYPLANSTMDLAPDDTCCLLCRKGVPRPASQMQQQIIVQIPSNAVFDVSAQNKANVQQNQLQNITGDNQAVNAFQQKPVTKQPSGTNNQLARKLTMSFASTKLSQPRLNLPPRTVTPVKLNQQSEFLCFPKQQQNNEAKNNTSTKSLQNEELWI